MIGLRPAVAIAAAAVVAGCANPPNPGPEPGPAARSTPVAPPAQPAGPTPLAGPERLVRVPAPLETARERVEILAARCWLDAELAAEMLLVDRRGGTMIAVGETEELLQIAFRPGAAQTTLVTLSGPALADPDRAGRMTAALDRVLEGTDPAC